VSNQVGFYFLNLYLDLINPFYQLNSHGIYISVLKYLYNFHFSFPYSIFLLELSPKFFKSLDEDAFLKLLQVHYYELFKRFSTHVYYYELFLLLFSKNHPLNAGPSLYEQHSRFTFLKHNTLNPTTGFLSRGSYRVMIYRRG
jgi:hypothetical protein